MSQHEPQAHLKTYHLVDSGDPGKLDLELTHTSCGEYLCDAGPGDTFAVLVGVITDHAANCATP